MTRNSITDTQLYLARGGLHWGVADSADEAVRIMRQQGPTPGGYHVVQLPLGIKSYTVDMFDGATWEYADPDDPRRGKLQTLQVVTDTREKKDS